METTFRFKATKYNIPDIEYFMLTEMKLRYDEFESKYREFAVNLKGTPSSRFNIALFINDFFKIESLVKRSFTDRDSDYLRNVLEVVILEMSDDDIIHVAIDHTYLKDSRFNRTLLETIPVEFNEKLETTLTITW